MEMEMEMIPCGRLMQLYDLTLSKHRTFPFLDVFREAVQLAVGPFTPIRGRALQALLRP
jgi:hypothetical protein